MKENEIYHYRTSYGTWEPIVLNKEQGKKWNDMCKKLAIKYPEDPHPYYDDYIEFIKSK